MPSGCAFHIPSLLLSLSERWILCVSPRKIEVLMRELVSAGVRHSAASKCLWVTGRELAKGEQNTGSA